MAGEPAAPRAAGVVCFCSGFERVPIHLEQRASARVRCFVDDYQETLLTQASLRETVSPQCFDSGYANPYRESGSVGCLGPNLWLLGIARIAPGVRFDSALTDMDMETQSVFNMLLGARDFCSYKIV